MTNSILVVDNEALAAASLQLALTRFGCDVELAVSSETAHDWLKKKPFDLILVEFDLSPRLNSGSISAPWKASERNWSGTGLIREIRGSGFTSPILVHT